jgi:hypothetical protein
MNKKNINIMALLYLKIVILFVIAGYLFPEGDGKLNEDKVLNKNESNTLSDICPDFISVAKEDVQPVLLYLKSIQENYSTDKWLVPAMEDNSGQTFNNALTAMAFILTGEKERSEKILNFYANRTDTLNKILMNQSFFYNGEARGFYQNVDLSESSYKPFICDRWMGDNVWLLLAYKYYEMVYGFSEKPTYSYTVSNLDSLLKNFFIDDPDGHGGFVQHGWRWGPRDSSTPQNDYKLHETDSQGKPVGHEEGNIDAYAAFTLCGEDEKARKIKVWLDYRMSELEKNPDAGLPLDLYSWRSLAFGNDGEYYKNLVLIPENDSRFKKEIEFNGKKAVGFFSFANADVQNVWLDGLGHMACAFYSSGYFEKGNFYTSQLDSFLIKRIIGGNICYALPYTANTKGGYDWVDTKKGFSSACAWYIFAKYAFNPYTFEKNPPTEIEKGKTKKLLNELKQNYPNPFNPNTVISYYVSAYSPINIKIYDLLGKEVITLINEEKGEGEYSTIFNGNNFPSGIYFCRLTTPGYSQIKKIVLIK